MSNINRPRFVLRGVACREEFYLPSLPLYLGWLFRCSIVYHDGDVKVGSAAPTCTLTRSFPRGLHGIAGCVPSLPPRLHARQVSYLPGSLGLRRSPCKAMPQQDGAAGHWRSRTVQLQEGAIAVLALPHLPDCPS